MEHRGKTTFDTNHIGSISESAITTRFLQLGYSVLIPYGGNQRYDMVIENEEGEIWRVQCKTARTHGDGTVIQFDTANHNVTGKNRQARHYRGQCDYFAVYYARLDKIYLLPVDQVGFTKVNLRLSAPKNNQETNVRWAKDYEL